MAMWSIGFTATGIGTGDDDGTAVRAGAAGTSGGGSKRPLGRQSEAAGMPDEAGTGGWNDLAGCARIGAGLGTGMGTDTGVRYAGWLGMVATIRTGGSNLGVEPRAAAGAGTDTGADVADVADVAEVGADTGTVRTMVGAWATGTGVGRDEADAARTRADKMRKLSALCRRLPMSHAHGIGCFFMCRLANKSSCDNINRPGPAT